MYVVKVIAIKKNIGKEYLTYFSTKKIDAGTIVTISVRNSTCLGMVIESNDGSQLKKELKDSSFTLRKIKSIKDKTPIDNRLVVAVQYLKDFYVATTGEILTEIIPSFLLKNIDKLSVEKIALDEASLSLSPHNIHFEAVQAVLTERIQSYKNTIRETFARGKSVFILVPTMGDLENLILPLSKGIEDFVYSFHGSFPVKDLVEKWKKVTNEKHPVLIIGTGQFLSIPRHDLGTIIVDCEHRRSYKCKRRPYLDFRIVAESLAEVIDAELIFGDTILSVETHYRLEKGELIRSGTFRQRIDSIAHPKIVDMCKEIILPELVSYESRMLGRDAKKEIDDTLELGKNVFLFAAKRGISSVTICSDCNTIVSCPKCTAPLLLLKCNVKENVDLPKEDLNQFVCQRCSYEARSSVDCTKCGGWRLTPLGIGAERVYEAVKSLYPHRKVFILTSDSAKTPAQAKLLRNEFEGEKGSILIGTEMALYFLRENVHTIVVVSLDSLFSVPDYRMNERIYSLVAELAERTGKKLLIQTRRPKEKIWNDICELRSASFLRDEVNERERFGYPPTTTLIKITWNGTFAKKEKAKEVLEHILVAYDPVFIDDRVSNKKNITKIVALIRLDRNKWPPNKTGGTRIADNNILDYNELLHVLRGLSRDYLIDVMPEDLLS